MQGSNLLSEIKEQACYRLSAQLEFPRLAQGVQLRRRGLYITGSSIDNRHEMSREFPQGDLDGRKTGYFRLT